MGLPTPLPVPPKILKAWRTARARGKRLGRPRVLVDARKIAALRSEGLSWAKIADRMGAGEGTGLPRGAILVPERLLVCRSPVHRRSNDNAVI